VRVGSAPGAPFHVLCVCTGNVFRSRIMEYELRRGFAARDASDQFEVSSVGVAATGGATVSDPHLEELRRVGVDLAAPVCVRGLTRDAVDQADLVLCGDRVHRSRVLELCPAALHRTFLFGEFARLSAVAPITRHAGGTAPVDRVERAHRARLTVASIAAHRARYPVDPNDAVPDPAGAPPERLDEVARRLAAAAASTLDVLLPVDRVRVRSGQG
jgi:protein-tyrosine phosphatase